jgi:hypothetical protein
MRPVTRDRSKGSLVLAVKPGRIRTDPTTHYTHAVAGIRILTHTVCRNHDSTLTSHTVVGITIPDPCRDAYITHTVAGIRIPVLYFQGVPLDSARRARIRLTGIGVT